MSARPAVFKFTDVAPESNARIELDRCREILANAKPDVITLLRRPLEVEKGFPELRALRKENIRRVGLVFGRAF